MKITKTASQQQQLGENIICKLCQHYIIDAVTILECVHSFCRSCLLKHLKDSKTCPVCKIDLGPKFAKAFRRDLFLQTMVYKLVPHIYWNEIKQRTEYLRKSVISEEEVAFLLDNDMTDLANHLCAPYEKIPLCIEYIRSAPTQEEADEELMDWRSHGDDVGSSNVSAVEPDQPGPSGLNCSGKVVDVCGNTGAKKVEQKSKADVEEITEVINRKCSLTRNGKRTAAVAVSSTVAPRDCAGFNIPVTVPEFKRYFLAEAKTKLLSIRKVLEGKLKVRENGVQLIFLDVTKNSVLEDDCTLQDIAYMFGWDRRDSMRVLFTLQREPADDEPPVLTMEEMPVLYKEEPFACQDEEKSDQLAPVITPVVLPPLTVTLDAAAMEGSGKQQPIIVTGPAQPPRKRRKVSSPTKRTSRTPPYPLQRMTGLSPHEKAPPMMQPQREVRESNAAKKNLNTTLSNSSAVVATAFVPSAGTVSSPPAKHPKLDSKSLAGEKQENLNSRIHEILVQKGLSSQASLSSVVTSTATTSGNTSGATSEGVSSAKTSTTSSCVSAVTRPVVATPAATVAAAIRSNASQSTTASSCIVPTNFISQLNGLQSRSDKASYEEFFRQLHSMPRFFPPGGLHSLCDPRIAQAPIKSVLSVPQTDVVPYLRPPPPSPYPSIMQQLSLKRKQ